MAWYDDIVSFFGGQDVGLDSSFDTTKIYLPGTPHPSTLTDLGGGQVSYDSADSIPEWNLQHREGLTAGGFLEDANGNLSINHAFDATKQAGAIVPDISPFHITGGGGLFDAGSGLSGLGDSVKGVVVGVAVILGLVLVITMVRK